MKITSPFIHSMGGMLGAVTIRSWMKTLDSRVAHYDPTVDPIHPDCREPRIYLFWHEFILLPIFFRSHCRVTMLVSRHRDAEALTHAAHHFGFGVIRGSTNRGGITALREMLRKSRGVNLAITPDGPRGPRRVLAQGAVYVASRLRMPLVVMGLGCDRPWRLASWDRFAIPRPYSRARGVIGPEMRLPADLDRDGIEHYRREVERLLNRLTCEAEAWAESGTRKQAEVRVIQAPLRRRARLDDAHAVQPPHYDQ